MSLVLGTAPEEDSGAETQDRYSWQHHCTAADCAAMMSEDSQIRRIVCEIHEDYVVDRGDDDIELVSCKHRETSQGPWSLTDICLGGGIAHLFSRWHTLSAARVRLVTNAGLKPGKAEAGEVANACLKMADGVQIDDELALCRDQLAFALLAARRQREFDGIPLTPLPPRRKAERLPPPQDFLNLVEKFMGVLRILPELPSRRYIRTQHVEYVMRPALDSIGHNLDAAGVCYDGLVALVAARNAANPLRGQYSSWLSEPRFGSARSVLTALVQSRTIVRDDILGALADAPDRPLLRRWTTTGHDRLRVKLVAGGVRGTRVSGALRLREAWLAQWEESKRDLPGDEAERQDLEAKILELAGDVEAEVATSDAGWGDRMYETLRARLRSGRVSPSSGLALTPEHLLGLALDLAADCEIWFSDEFDVEAALRDVADATNTSAPDLERAQ
ncbi:hypothetical protein GCM10023322_25690 [Rugosimonospora acidiphila]|uniref:CD-NTase associated protein 4-like DNA endonuclease domain-containing protein n=1 Tax=Rugosimonospora acidiphila TaxID=556531 RepID=A0ABP9RRW3_9ACTN